MCLLTMGSNLGIVFGCQWHHRRLFVGCQEEEEGSQGRRMAPAAGAVDGPTFVPCRSMESLLKAHRC